MNIKHSRKILPVTLTAIFSVILATVLFFSYQSRSNAADISKFDPGNLMSDSVMSNRSSMNVQQIQAFLNSRNACNNTNVHLAQRYPHLQYNIRNGRFVCMAQDSFNGKSAAQIIWQAGQDYNINPQVLIVLLEKEQGLISDTWPNHVQYRTAAGFGCPDNLPAGAPPCEAQYFGLENQVRLAANLFRSVLNGGWSNYPVGRTFVQYHPNAACGGTHINIQNRATSALYRYTPYQPNQAALNAGYGTGDGCSAYGNRNFWRLFTDWFGSTQGSAFQSLDNPRWMQVKNNTYKRHVHSGERAGGMVAKGQQIRFIDKALIDNKWHLRTEFNFNDGGEYAIPQSDLEEIPYTPITPAWMTLTTHGNRSHPASRTSTGDSLAAGTSVKVVDKITIDGNVYYRTEFNKNNNQDAGIHARFLRDFHAISLDGPRAFCSKGNSSVRKINPQTGATVSHENTNMFMIDKKTLINGVWYFQDARDQNTLTFIDSRQLADSCYTPFEGPRDMVLNKDTTRFNPITKESYDVLKEGTVISLSTKIKLDDEWFFRTEWNTRENTNAVIPASAFSEL